MGKESRISLFKQRLEGENKEYNGTLPPSSCIQKIYVSVIVYTGSFLCVNISTFCAAGDFYGAFQLQKLHQYALFRRCIFIFFYGFLIFYNFSSLTTYFQMGSIYTRPVFPTSRALITVVEKKVHISAAQ